MSKRVQSLALLFLWLFGIPMSVGAQSASTATLDPPNTLNFPEISTSLKPFGDQGEFLHNLRLEEITIIENDALLGITALDERHPGTQFVVAISLERAFAIRDSNGISRYDRILDAFTLWAAGQPEDFRFPVHDHIDQEKQASSQVSHTVSKARNAIHTVTTSHCRQQRVIEDVTS